ncbi:hypothetical protein [Paraburkholderia bannensis]|uniref:hypothetical protein n=1 Tax=Paraburkholderia bannensis TaxID=765414 RepID=UPI002AB5E4B9|nr:hypothetical protein [Paraburkholderia bannensis]
MDGDGLDARQPQEETSESQSFMPEPGELYSYLGADNQETFFRFLCVDGSNVWVMEVGERTSSGIELKSPPKTMKLRRCWKAAYARLLYKTKRLRLIDESYGRPVEMPKVSIEDGIFPELDRRRSLVRYVRAAYGHSIVSNKAMRAEAIENAMLIFSVCRPAVAKWLEMDLFYGGHENGTMDHHWLKGGKGNERRGLRDERGEYVTNLGRPTDNERLDPNTRHKRKRMLPSLYDAWLDFVRVQAWENYDPATVILDRFKATRVGFNCDADGNVVAHLVDPKHFPEDANMLRSGRPVLKAERHAREEAQQAAANRRSGARGGSSRDLVDGALSILDIDATRADINVRFGDKKEFIAGVGQPTVFVAIDRGSNAVVGWYVTFGTENADGYKNCLFSAFTTKEREVRKWGLPHMKGLVYGCTHQVFMDRGPASSRASLEAMAKRLSIDGLMAEPYNAKGKGLVERIMEFVQEEVTNILGSKRPTGNEKEDREKRKNAKKNTVMKLEQYMQALIKGFNRWNLTSDARHLHTADMVDSIKKVHPVPCEIYNYYKRLRDVAYEWNWSEEKIYLNLCEKYENKAAPGGVVTIATRHYSSENLRAVSRAHENINSVPGKKETLKSTFYEIPNAPMNLIWKRDDGILELLEPHGDTKRSYRDDSRGVHDFLTRLRNADYRIALYKSRKDPKGDRAIDKDRLSALKQKNIEDVEKNSHHIDPDESAVDRRKRAHAHAEKRRAKDVVDDLNRNYDVVPQDDDERDSDEYVDFTDYEAYEKLRI